MNSSVALVLLSGLLFLSSSVISASVLIQLSGTNTYHRFDFARLFSCPRNSFDKEPLLIPKN